MTATVIPFPGARVHCDAAIEQRAQPPVYCDPEFTDRDRTREADLRQRAAFERARREATPFARRRQRVLCDSDLPPSAA